MNINAHIKDLLFTYDKVIIPGLGTFYAEYIPAEINKTTNVISPPTKRITFNPDQKIDDGLLLKYIIEKEGINDGEAKREINTFIYEIRKLIKEKGYYLFKGIGKLFFNKGKYTFEQYYKANFLLDSFGMTEITLESKDISTPELKKVERRKEFKTSARIYDRERTRRRILIYTPIAAALIFLFVYIDMVSFNDELIYPSEYKSLQQQYKQSSTSDENIKLVEKIDPATDKRKALLYTENKVNHYFIIAGSFKSLVNAEEFANNLKKQGFTTQIIDGNLYRISIGAFATRSEAQKELNRLKSTATPSLWILSK